MVYHSQARSSMNIFEVYKSSSGKSYRQLASALGASKSYIRAILHSPGDHDNLMFLIRIGARIGMSDQLVRDSWVILRRATLEKRIDKRAAHE